MKKSSSSSRMKSTDLTHNHRDRSVFNESSNYPVREELEFGDLEDITFHDESNPIHSFGAVTRDGSSHDYKRNNEEFEQRKRSDELIDTKKDTKKSSKHQTNSSKQEVINLVSPKSHSKSKTVSSREISKSSSSSLENMSEIPPRVTRLSSSILKKPSSESKEDDEMFRFKGVPRRNAELKEEGNSVIFGNDNHHQNYDRNSPVLSNSKRTNSNGSTKKRHKSGREIISIPSSEENSPEKIERVSSIENINGSNNVNMSSQSQSDEDFARSLQMELDNSSRFNQFHNYFGGGLLSPTGRSHKEMSEDELLALRLQRESYLGLDDQHIPARENDEADRSLARMMQQEEEENRNRHRHHSSRSRRTEEEFLRNLLRNFGGRRGFVGGLGMMLGSGLYRNQVDVDNMSYEDLLALSERIGDVKSKGASENLIEQLPVGLVSKEGDTCAVCLDDMNIGDSSRTLPCLHQYHVDCIDKWLKTNRHCPVCNKSINPNE